ncbi:MAG: hypothetical protein VX589_13380 [Myxococcota bacterium]|nr:hypothetical protein [Myxococcota bacterium]
MKLSCPACASAIVSTDINIEALVAKCSACDEVFAFGQFFHSATASDDDGPKAPQIKAYEYAKPAGLSVREDESKIELTRRWFRLSALPLLGFATVWDTLLVGWYAMVGAVPDVMGSLFLVFPLIHVGVGIGLTYLGLAKVFNRTTIQANRQKIRVAHGPFRWGKPREIHVSAIQKLYVHKEHHRRRGQGIDNPKYAVHALLKGGGSVPLVDGLTGQFQALFIEQELERFLGLDTSGVIGEYQPPPHEILVGRVRREAGSLSLSQTTKVGTLSMVEERQQPDDSGPETTA